MQMIKTGTKECRICHRRLPISDFYVKPDAKDGHSNHCKHCTIERTMQKRVNAPAHKVAHKTEEHEVTTYVCIQCGRELPEAEFVDAAGRRRHGGRCRDCRSIVKRKVRVANGMGERHEYHAKRYAEHKHEIKVRQVLGKEESEKVAIPRIKPKPERLCLKCANWPCFDGIENLESDFAREGCHAFRQRGEAS